MNILPSPANHRAALGGLRACVAAALVLGAGLARAGSTDITNAPLFTSSGTSVKPNIMFVLDDSGSMSSNYMPDEANFASTKYGKNTSQCNGLAFNPNIIYQPPVNSTGVSAANGSTSTLGYTPSGGASVSSPTSQSIVAAGTKLSLTLSSAASYSAGQLVTLYDATQSSYMVGAVTAKTSRSTSLSVMVLSSVGSSSLSGLLVTTTLPGYYFTYGGTQTAMSYSYSGTGVVTSTTFYGECNSTIAATPGSTAFKMVLVPSLPTSSTTSGANQTNYANWLAYYDTRIQMMKTAMSLAFSPLDDRYRVGFTKISKSSGVVLDIDTFDATQKAAFYTDLFAVSPGGTTPLRGALSNAGRYFAKKMPGQTKDPMQYACQKNFTIMSTDGYWNTGSETSTYGPLDVNGASVGEQDGGSTPRPMHDDPSYPNSNTLADVAAYYFNTDLRNTSLGNCTGALGSDVCGTTDHNPTQNMTSFTLGLGVNGTLSYDENYLKQTSGDYYNLTQGTKNWPNPTVSSSGGDPTNVDDLWHAAVNGHGQYFSARDPAKVITSLNSALLTINQQTGAAAAAATSTLEPVTGDNDVFVAQFTSAKWTGNLLNYTIDPTTGQVSTTAGWGGGLGGAAVLDARIAAGTSPRQIYYFKPGSGNTGSLRAFNYVNLTADSLNGYFDNFCSKTGAGGSASPGQCGTLNVTDLATANQGANLVGYLRGQALSVYRSRDSALGDIIDAAPLYVGAPKFKYTENGYTSFASANSTRPGVVYVGGNDGMLHAFDRATGNELWAYIPSMVMTNMYKLADANYPANHSYFVDGAPRMGDIYVNGAWKTILVGGLNGGGRGYYALDVTDPNNPIALWEFTDANLGLSFGNPIITKRKDGTWVVVFASGYNNTSGDGNGHLFVLNANTGAKLLDLATYTSGGMPAGSPSNPSGLAKVNAYVTSEIDNTAIVFYGGDLFGNLWRFDIDSNVPPYGQAMRLAYLQAGGKAQPITTKPVLAQVSYNGSKYNVVYVGTGRYLGTSDLASTDQQSLYAIKDTWTSTGLGDVRASGTLVAQTLTGATGSTGTAIRTASTNAVNWTTKNGWYVDFPSAGERVNVDMVLTLNALSVVTNIPTTDACDAGGQSWLYNFDIGSGSAISNATDAAVGISLGNVLAVGQTVVQLPNGATVTITTRSDATLSTTELPPAPPTGTLKRTSWRELVD
jgi:type IV pilus assembly protein PilY1